MAGRGPPSIHHASARRGLRLQGREEEGEEGEERGGEEEGEEGLRLQGREEGRGGGSEWLRLWRRE
uniref:Uncharacterized protein n=1 Tax=Oryza sativa subsp. japonica TaxID=39947 RepID=Q6YXS4_ORYSJ|nr:hypothetical protein [Oryza sativa Japonica Group]BAD33086.1 hypothetical protein [Oryza sativa Japonica Group]